jgi:hypothetical protein
MIYKKFLLKSLLFIALVVATVETTFRLNPFNQQEFEEDYSATIIDKHRRLDSLKSSKIVLIAGSNFAYGINSELIEKAFNRPVVNMAIHYSLGTDFMLRQLENKLNKGDIVVMGFEYIADSKGDITEKMLAERYYPKAKNWYEFDNIYEEINQQIQFRISTFRRILTKLTSPKPLKPSIEDTTSLFFRGGVNQYGDLVSHLNNPSLSVIPNVEINDKKKMTEPINDMNRFTQKMKAKGVSCFYSYPSYGQSSYKTDKPILDKMDVELHQKGEFIILGKMQDFIYPDSLLQDMVFHLNAKGREIRTQQVIELLKPFLPASAQPIADTQRGH